MDFYYGTKLIQAEPKQKAVNTPEGDVGFMDGYKVIYDNNYESWSPKDVFEAAYKKSGEMNFGHAIEALKSGEAVARAGWNGKGMFIWLNLGSHSSSVESEYIAGVSRALFTLGQDDTITRLPNLNMRAADGATITGWLASQTDVLAEDWGIVTLTNEA